MPINSEKDYIYALTYICNDSFKYTNEYRSLTAKNAEKWLNHTLLYSIPTNHEPWQLIKVFKILTEGIEE